MDAPAINGITIDKKFCNDIGTSYEQIAVSQAGENASSEEVAKLTQQLQELNNNKELKEGDQVFIPLEYAVDEMQANVTNAQNAVTTKQTAVSTAQSNLSAASSAVATALSTYNAAMSQSATKQVKGKDGKIETVQDDTVIAAQNQAKQAYDAAVQKEAQMQQALQTAQSDLDKANQEVEKLNGELETAKGELKNQEDLSKQEQKEIEEQISKVQGQLEQAKANAEIEQQKIKAEAEASQQAANQNQAVANSLGEKPNSEDVEKAMGNTVSSIKYIPTSDGKQKQIIKYADGSSSENNQREGKDKDGNKLIYFGEVKTDDKGNVLRDESGRLMRTTDKNGIMKSDLNLDSDGDALYGGDDEQYKGKKTKYIANENRAYDYQKADYISGRKEFIHLGSNFGVSNPEEAIIEKRKDDKGNDYWYVANAKGLNITSHEYSEALNLVVEDSEISSIHVLGKKDNNITVNNSKFISDELQNGLFTDNGKDTITINNSTFEDDAWVNSCYGDDTVNIFNSKSVNVGLGEGTDGVVIENSTVNEIYGNKGVDTIILKNSSANKIDGGDDSDDVLLYNGSSVNDMAGAEKTSYNLSENNALPEIKETKDADSAEFNKPQVTTNPVAEKYFGKGAKITPQQEVQAAWLDYLVTNNDSLQAQLKDRDEKDGIAEDGYNAIKELTDIGVPRSYIDTAISDQEKANNDLKDALLGKSDKYSSFEEAYKDITGVEYDEAKIMDYMETQSMNEIVSQDLNNAAAMEQKLANASSFQEAFDVFTEYYGSEGEAVEQMNKLLKEDLGTFGADGMKDLQIVSRCWEGKTTYELSGHGDDRAYLAMQGRDIRLNAGDKGYQYICGLDKTFNPFKDKTPFTDEIKEAFKETTGTTVDEMRNTLEEQELAAVGKNTAAQRIMDQYCDEQSGVKKKISEILSTTGKVITIAGAAITMVNPAIGQAVQNVGYGVTLVGNVSDETLMIIDEVSSGKCSFRKLASYGKDFVADFARSCAYIGACKLSIATGQYLKAKVATKFSNMAVQTAVQQTSKFAVRQTVYESSNLVITDINK